MSGEKTSLSPLCSAISWPVTASLLLLFVVCTPSARAAEAWHPTHGAGTLPMGHPAIEFMAGYPQVLFQVDIPVTSFLEVIPYVGLNYGQMGGFGVNQPLPVEGVALKFTVWNDGLNAIALSFDTANEWLAGIRIMAPGFLFSHQWDNPRFAIFTGFSIPYVWVVVYGMEFRFRGTLGVEYGINDHFSIHLGVDAGLWLGYDEDESDLIPASDFSARFGFSYTF